MAVPIVGVVGGSAAIGGPVELGDVVGDVAVRSLGTAEMDGGEQSRQRPVFVCAHDVTGSSFRVRLSRPATGISATAQPIYAAVFR